MNGDDDSQDFMQTVAKVAQLPVRMIRARNLGGATGTATLSWAFIKGKPRVQVHNPKNIYVHSWEDRDGFIPRHVTEAYLYPQDEYNADKRRFERLWDRVKQGAVVLTDWGRYLREVALWQAVAWLARHGRRGTSRHRATADRTHCATEVGIVRPGLRRSRRSRR